MSNLQLFESNETHFKLYDDEILYHGTYQSEIFPMVCGKVKCIINEKTKHPRVLIISHALKITRLVFFDTRDKKITGTVYDDVILLYNASEKNECAKYTISFKDKTDKGKVKLMKITKSDSVKARVHGINTITKILESMK